MINIFKRWSSHFKEYDIDDSLNPWAGLASYEDPETAERKLKFCGRDDDSYDLTRLIMGNVFVTLYGKSGIGKTSLLNAGVFPELREEHYTPISIRLGMRDEEHLQSYQTMIIEAVERVVKRTETINVIGEQLDQQSIDYLWNYFARHRFYDKYDEQTTPVIVFDQFEEVFRSPRNEADTLLRQLDYLNDKDHTLDGCQVDGRPYCYEQNFRFVVSIREDDLYRLEDSIDNCYLPALKRCRYRLRSLLEEDAEMVVLIPGEGLFKQEEQKGIVDTIIKIARNKEDKSISTNVLSLICSRVFIDFQKSEADHITPILVDSFVKGNPFERFYNEATSGFSNREKNYIEDHLVDSTGRRNSIPESDFLLHVKNGFKLLSGDTRILQRTSTSSDGDNYRIELIHDSFCGPLTELKKKRGQRKLFFRTTLITVFVLTCIAIASLIFSQREIISQSEIDLIEKNDSLKEIITQLEESKMRILKLYAHHELWNYMKEDSNFSKGVIYLVETKTGRIKIYDCINIEEGLINQIDEFKTERNAMLYAPTYLSLLESNVVDSSYVVDTGCGVYGEIKDHNWRRGGYGTINLARALEVRSQVAFAKAIEYVYGSNISKHEENINHFLGGQPDFPIGILTFYNAIANDGCMVKIVNDNEDVVIMDSCIAQKKCVKILQRGLINSVSQGLAKKAGSYYMEIAAGGRTFVINETDNVKKYRMEFCGYFPADTPQYTMMVILEKDGLPASAGGMCGIIMHHIMEAALGVLFNVTMVDDDGNKRNISPEKFLGLEYFDDY